MYHADIFSVDPVLFPFAIRFGFPLRRSLWLSLPFRAHSLSPSHHRRHHGRTQEGRDNRQHNGRSDARY